MTTTAATKRSTTTTATMSMPVSFLLAILLLLSPSSLLTIQIDSNANANTNTNRIPWAAAAISPASDAAAAAATIRRNVVSGAAIFTIGDVAAQLLTASQTKKQQLQKRKLLQAKSKEAAASSSAAASEAPIIVVAPVSGVIATNNNNNNDKINDFNSEDLEDSNSDCSDTEEIDTETETTKLDTKALSKTAASLSLSSSVAAPQTNPKSKAATKPKLDAVVDLFRALKHLDKNRLWSATVLGAIWSGFCVPFIYGNVENRFPGKANLRQILTKVLVTCSILSTIGNYATMFARRFVAQCTTLQFDKQSSLRFQWFARPVGSLLLLGATCKGCVKSCNHDIGEVIVDDLKIWPLYDLTCYGLIPPAWRSFTTSIMSSGWAMYMSVVSAKEQHEDDDDEHEHDHEHERESKSETYHKQVQVLQVETQSTKNSSNGKSTTTATTSTPPQDNKTVRVTSVAAPSKVIPASSKTTKRIIAVAGGTTTPLAVTANANTYADANVAGNAKNIHTMEDAK